MNEKITAKIAAHKSRLEMIKEHITRDAGILAHWVTENTDDPLTLARWFDNQTQQIKESIRLAAIEQQYIDTFEYVLRSE